MENSNVYTDISNTLNTSASNRSASSNSYRIVVSPSPHADTSITSSTSTVDTTTLDNIERNTKTISDGVMFLVAGSVAVVVCIILWKCLDNFISF